MGYKRRLVTKQRWDEGHKTVNIERQQMRRESRVTFEEKDVWMLAEDR
jgi:hypothetical protein